MVNRISFERKVRKNVGTFKFEYAEGPLGEVLRTSWGRPESASQGRPLNVGLGPLLKVISGRHIGTSPGRQIGTSSGRSNRIFRGRPGYIRGGCLGTFWGPIFAGWEETLGVVTIAMIWLTLALS